MSARKIAFLLATVVLVFACNLPQPATAPAASTPAAATAAATPTLRHEKPLQITPSATAPPAPTVDDFFDRCPTAAEIAAVDKDVHLAFEYNPPVRALSCQAAAGSADLTELQKRAYQSVLIMKQLVFDAPLPWTDKSLYDWFAGTIKGIRFRNNIQYSNCCEPADVINIRVAENSYLMITPRWIDPAVGGGLMDLMVLYVHEARHNQGFPHTCANGQDDKTLAGMGAWGVQYYLLQWLAQHSDRAFLKTAGPYPDIYRKIALDDSLMIQRSRFCGEPTATPGDDPTLAP
jgi:hypothetical protein